MSGVAGLYRCILVAATVLISVAALADQQVSGNIEISAVVVANCRFTLSPLSFGSYDPLH